MHLPLDFSQSSMRQVLRMASKTRQRDHAKGPEAYSARSVPDDAVQTDTRRNYPEVVLPLKIKAPKYDKNTIIFLGENFDDMFG